jgi:DNA-binding response OmpR family regulator
MQNCILIVEDETDLSDLISFTLQTAGFKTVAVSTAEGAYQTVLDQHFDGVVLDLLLPDLDGISLCEMLRKLPNTQNAAILMLTACATRDAEALGRSAGADDYMTKPLQLNELIARLKLRLNLRALPTDQQQCAHL